MATKMVLGTGFSDIKDQLEPGALFLQVSWSGGPDNWHPSKFRIGHLSDDQSPAWNKCQRHMTHVEGVSLSHDTRHGLEFYQINERFDGTSVNPLQLLSDLCQVDR